MARQPKKPKRSAPTARNPHPVRLRPRRNSPHPTPAPITVAFSSAGESFLNAVCNGITEAVLAVNVETRHVMYWNRGAETMFGYPRDAILGQRTDFLYPADASFRRMSEISTPAVQKQGYWSGEWAFQRRDGSRFSAEVTLTTFLQTGTADAHAVTVIRDITERQQTEETLRRREEEAAQKSALLQLLQEVAVAANEAQSLDTALQYTVEKICAHTGWCIGHAYLPTGKGPDKLAPSAVWYLGDTKRFAAFRRQTEKIQEVPEGELPHRVFVRGEPEWSMNITTDPHFSRAKLARRLGLKAALAFPVLIEKETVAVMEFFSSDAVEPETPFLEVMANVGTQLGRVFERKHAEQQLSASERLAAIGATAAKLAHEIGNPLNGMHTTVQLLERHLTKQPETADDIVGSAVHDLAGEIRRLRTLLTDLRSLARPRQLNLQPTNLATLVEEVLALEKQLYSDHRIQVHLRIPPTLSQVMIDSEKLKQVLLNLCQNAVEAMPQGGTLTVQGGKTEQNVWLEVVDTGVGIPEEVDVFDLFVTTKAEGTGLGLAIVQQIVQAHGGTITYTSTPNTGTTFRVTLPWRGA